MKINRNKWGTLIWRYRALIGWEFSRISSKKELWRCYVGEHSTGAQHFLEQGSLNRYLDLYLLLDSTDCLQ